MSYAIYVGNIQKKFYGVDESIIWSNLTWEAILEDDELLVGAYEYTGYHLDNELDYEQLEVYEKAQWVKDSDDFYDLRDDYYPIADYVYVLQHEPTEDEILDIAKNARNVVVIKDEHENYLLGLTSCGMFVSGQVAYAYMVIDKEVPRCFEIGKDEAYGLNEDAHKALVDFIKERG